ncbi:MAG TPA: hypothetical protein VK273_11560 [Gaiellaceae bacterium]|nr:hypothetical protein [Gaiellaceae bacterium]
MGFLRIGAGWFAEDVETSIDYYVPTATSGHVSPLVKGRLVNGKFYHLKAHYSATNNGINVQKFVNGATTDLAGYTTTFRRGTGWKRMVLKVVGNTVTASHYALDANRENPVHDATEKLILNGQDAIDFGGGVRGDAGYRWVPTTSTGEPTTSVPASRGRRLSLSVGG